MSELTAEQFAQRAFNVGVLDERQLDSIWAELRTREVPLNDLTTLLVRRELLTNWQLDKLLRDDRAGYFYGPYMALYLVGTGTFARVFRAVEKETGRVVALKVLRRRWAEDTEKTEQFMHEGNMGMTLRHPAIVPIYNVHSEKRSFFLTMEFVEGQSLRDFVKVRGKVDPLEATKLIEHVAEGLAHAGERGITHRDLKLSNVLISSRGQAKLVDFGLASINAEASDEALQEFPNPRTIDYAALERCTGVRKDDSRSDIYFLGCIYYHMLAGKAPHRETKDRLQRMNATRLKEVTPITELVEDLPVPAVLVVNKAMELDPKKRYQTPGELAADLKLAIRRMEDAAARGDSLAFNAVGAEAQAATLTPDAPKLEGDDKSIMFVESSMQMQNILREQFKKVGYRVLVVSDPARAAERFTGGEQAADCVVFSTTHLGRDALEAFNDFGTDEQTDDIPAVLLLGDKHKAWQPEANLNDHRILVEMPVRMKQFRAALRNLLNSSDA